jgi:hypothetical protein
MVILHQNEQEALKKMAGARNIQDEPGVTSSARE